MKIGVGGNANFTDKTEILIRPEGIEGTKGTTSIILTDNSEKYVAFDPSGFGWHEISPFQ